LDDLATKIIFSMRSSISQGSGLIGISLCQQAGNGAAAVGAGARLAVGLLSPPMDGESAGLSREGAYYRGLILWEQLLADAALAKESCLLQIRLSIQITQQNLVLPASNRDFGPCSRAQMLDEGSEDGSLASVKLGLDEAFEDGFEDG
jgi:hypothetical protein